MDMAEQKHMLYFMGNINGDIKLFRQVWIFIKEYLSEGPATIFISGNFGLNNSKFLDDISSEIRGLVEIHVAGGNQAKEGWDILPPPLRGKKEVRPGIFVHAFGSTHTIQGYTTLFLGQSEAIPEDFLPYPKRIIYDIRPKYLQMCDATEIIEKVNPDILVSHALPSKVMSSFLKKNTDEKDLRRKRLADRIIPSLDTLYVLLNRQKVKQRWWFGASCNVLGNVKNSKNINFISLCSLIMVRGSMASLEINSFQNGNLQSSSIGNLAYA